MPRLYKKTHPPAFISFGSKPSKARWLKKQLNLQTN